MIKTAAAALTTASMTAYAQPSDDLWSLNGYGTFGMTHSSEGRADYVPNFIVSEGPGLTRDMDTKLDTRLALQLSVQPSERLSGVVQIISEQHYDTTFTPMVEWANLQYELTPEWSIRVGRTAMNTFMVSDYRKVAYSLPWIRPPAELYHLLPLTNSDGVGLLYHRDWDDSHYSAELHYGSTQAKELDGLLEAPRLWSFNHHLDRGALSLHLSYLLVEVDYGSFLDALWNGYRSFGPAGEAVVARYNPSGEWSDFGALGVRYDPGNWFVMAEWGHGDIGSDFGSRDGRYISAGYRVGSLTPYISYARVGGGHSSVDGLEPANFPAPYAPAIDQLNAGLLINQQGFGARQGTWSVGSRWDFMPGVSAKLQYDHVKTLKGSPGIFRNNPPGYRPRGADVVSLSVDFVF